MLYSIYAVYCMVPVIQSTMKLYVWWLVLCRIGMYMFVCLIVRLLFVPIMRMYTYIYIYIHTYIVERFVVPFIRLIFIIW